MIFVVLFDEVLHYGAGFEETDDFAIGELVCESWDAAVGVDFEEPGLFLGVLLDVYVVGFVREAEGGDLAFH